MKEKFETLFFVKSSLISLYLALTIPIPLITIYKLKILSIITFVLGLFLIINITNDYVETCNKKISYKTSFLSGNFGKKSWEIYWKDIKFIKSFPTSQGSKVYYFITNKDENFLIPQRIDNFREFLSIISNNTGIKVDELTYISPLWTYKLLTFISLLMIIGEIISFSI
tara:strand:+ start:235 stop:741 length:507 start_codon:yes stop_codon:yes gene_type:complete